MSVKLSGLELKEFASRPEGEHEVWDDDSWVINGQKVDGWDLNVYSLSDADRCTLRCGTWYPSNDCDVDRRKSLSFVVKQWLKSRTCRTVCILVNNEHMDKLRSVIEENGWKIIK